MTLPTRQKGRTLRKLVLNVGWLPFSKGRDIWIASRNSMTQVAEILDNRDE